MRRNIEFKNVTAKEELSKLTEELAAKIEKRVKSFPQETVYLRLFIEEPATNKPWTVSATLELPGKTIAAKEEARDAHTAIRAVFAELERLIDAYKSSLRGEPSWKRQSRRKQLREQKAGTAGAKQEDGGAFFSIVGPHIAALSDYVGHLLGYAEARGDLVPGEVTAEDIVDQTLLRAHDEFYRRAPAGDIRAWLNRLAKRELDAEIRRWGEQRSRIVYMEQPIRPQPPEREVTTLGEEILDFYQPDEALKFEDVVPDTSLMPDRAAEIHELHERIRAALNGLPKKWRRLLWFRYALGLNGNQLATALKRPAEEIERSLAAARKALWRNLKIVVNRPPRPRPVVQAAGGSLLRRPGSA